MNQGSPASAGTESPKNLMEAMEGGNKGKFGLVTGRYLEIRFADGTFGNVCLKGTETRVMALNDDVLNQLWRMVPVNGMIRPIIEFCHVSERLGLGFLTESGNKKTTPPLKVLTDEVLRELKAKNPNPFEWRVNPAMRPLVEAKPALHAASQ